MDTQELYNAALDIRKRAYAPYSGYRVGAALIDESGNLHVGCNVENAAYPEGNCAETSAIAAMVANGGTRIQSIVVAGGLDDISACSPCGGCRQRIHEFADAATRIWMVDNSGRLVELSIEQLLPGGFAL